MKFGQGVALLCNILEELYCCHLFDFKKLTIFVASNFAN